MPVFVVDTNVAIAANGKANHVDDRCQLRCVERLESVVNSGIIALDNANCIFDEYLKHLCGSGRPGMGDMFFKYVHDHQWRGDRVRRVDVTPLNDNQRGFEELPENAFDPSDRKFLAVAVAAEATVLNATDNDWTEHQALMNELGVEVEELCPQHIGRRHGKGG